MCNDRLGRDDKRKLFDVAIKKQTKVMLDNISGKGLDIPLLGLREGVKEAGLQEFQELFHHQSYASLNHFKLSTSQVPVALPMSFMGKLTLVGSVISQLCYICFIQAMEQLFQMVMESHIIPTMTTSSSAFPVSSLAKILIVGSLQLNYQKVCKI